MARLSRRSRRIVRLVDWSGPHLHCRDGSPDLGTPDGPALMRDLTDRALDAAMAAGASYADVRIERLERQVVSVKNGRPDGLLEDESQGFGVRVLVDGAWGFASSSRVEPREIERVARRAVEIARASA